MAMAVLGTLGGRGRGAKWIAGTNWGWGTWGGVEVPVFGLVGIGPAWGAGPAAGSVVRFVFIGSRFGFFLRVQEGGWSFWEKRCGYLSLLRSLGLSCRLLGFLSLSFFPIRFFWWATYFISFIEFQICFSRPKLGSPMTFGTDFSNPAQINNLVRR